MLLFDTFTSADVLVCIEFAKQNLLLHSSSVPVVPLIQCLSHLLQVSFNCFVYWLISFNWRSEIYQFHEEFYPVQCA